MTLEVDYRHCSPKDALTAMERIHVATLDSATLNDMLVRVLDEVLEIFDSDRAWLIYPCQLDASQVRILLERTKPEWPGAGTENVNVPMSEPIRALMAACLESDGPVRSDPLSSPIVECQNEAMRSSPIRSRLVMALWPKGDDPWMLGIHHCAQAHVYEDAVPLFRAIGNRVAGAIGAELAMRGLRQSEERFRALVEYAPEAITMLDVDTGLYVDANPMAEALHGLPRDALIGKLGPADLSPEFQLDGRPSSEAAPAYLSRALAGEFPKFEWLHLTPDGQETLCEVSLARLPDPHRKLVRASITDITERKAAEAEHAELEAKLAQAQKLDAIGQLTAGVSHDFNNMLAVISGNAELLEDKLGKDDKVLSSVIRAAKRGADLTQRLLAFSRKQVLNPKVVNANNLIADITGLLRRTLEEHIDIEIVTGAGLWNCEVDLAQLENALVNLAINARDAMPDGGKLTIETANSRLDDDYAAAQAEVMPGQYVMLAVTDTGTGMAPGVREHAFEPFFTTKEVGAGSGLGLSMVYGFVKQSDGHVTIYSEQGEGTTIKLYLPRSTKTGVAERKPAMDEVPVARGETVLVVEDDPDLRTLAVALLSDLGYQVMEAGTGAAALEQLGPTARVNLLLTDVMLPGGMNGRELAEQADLRAPGIQVLYMSGYTADAIVHQGRLDVGATLLQKPFRRAGLARAIRQILDGSSP